MKTFSIKKTFTLLLITLLALSLCACSVEEAVDYIDAGIAIYEAIQESEDILEETENIESTDNSPVTTTGPPEKTEEPVQDAETKGSDESTPIPTEEPTPEPTPEPEPELDRDGEYTSKEDVALYIHLYGELPANFITKKTARSMGWSGGGLDDYVYGGCIGGDRFGNYEGLLPEKSGRTYTECDIDTLHKNSRGAKRIVFSNDGLIYYTDDHYESFTLLYGEE